MPGADRDVASASWGFVGRADVLERAGVVLDRALSGRSQLLLLSGEAGIGKTTVAERLADEAEARGAVVAWGTCWDSERAPGFWPWTQVLRGVRSVPHALDGLAAGDRAQLARILPELGDAPAAGSDDGDPEQARFRLFEAVATLLERVARQEALVVVVDDLQWADASSLELLEFVTRPRWETALLLVGTYRDEEITPGGTAAAALARLAGRADAITLTGLDDEAVAGLLRHGAGAAVAERWAAEVYRRTDGHPFFVRQLAQLLMTSPEAPHSVPGAVRETVERRLARLSPECSRLLDAAAVAGNRILPDVLADVLEVDPPQVAELVQEALDAGVLTIDTATGRARFAHDLFRETIYSQVAVRDRAAAHCRVGTALERRRDRSGTAFPGELARHFAAAIATDDPGRAVRWAIAAAEADRAGLAFAEAAGHIARVRAAAEDAGVTIDPATNVDLLCLQADAVARDGQPGEARRLLDQALAFARLSDDPARMAAVALGVEHLGARFAMPRDESIHVLEEARRSLAGSASALEAAVTAGVARALSHSVPEQRPRAQPLSEAALAIAREADDPGTLATCLLARHDVIWGPGTARERADLAGEIVELSERHGDRERASQGYVLRANALLELGSPAFRPALARFLQLAEGMGEPRHEYLALTRRAALALLEGDVDEGERLVVAASELGARIGEPDEGNVRMSQMLGVALPRNDPDTFVAVADEAVEWWVGIPSHSHAVAAGFRARAGDLDGARRHLAVVTELGTWRDDRSYMWSVFVPAMTIAAAALGDRDLCAVLHDELAAVADTCGVNGAVVCFMGSHAHWAGIAAAALDDRDGAFTLFETALATHERLGARWWAAETRARLEKIGATPRRTVRRDAADRVAVLHRDGELWEVGIAGHTAHIRDAKGLRDLVVLLGQPGNDVPALELAAPGTGAPKDTSPLLDARARAEYRQRLQDLEQERADAERARDDGRVLVLDAEREAIMSELRAATGLGGRPRRSAGDPVERARKAVSARIRDAIRRIEAVSPELGAHLDRSVVTGLACRYQPAEPLTWQLG